MVDRRLKIGALAALGAALLVAAVVDRRRARAAMCEGAPPVLDADGVRVMVESEIDGLVLRPGRVARCDDPGATPVWRKVRDLVREAQLVRPDGRPVVAHHAPKTRRDLPLATRLEVHEASGELVCGRDAVDTDASVWIHELTHARVATGTAPRARGAHDVLRALGEAAGDFVAASVTGRATIGSSLVVRDLSAPPRLGPEGFAALSLGHGVVDPHAVGWDIAAALYAAPERRAPSFRAGLLRCFDAPRAEDDAVELVRAFVAACPPEVRGEVRGVVRQVTPEGVVPE